MSELKTYLAVPYAEKDAAKALGARWDAAQKKWYVPATVDLSLFAKWQVVNTASSAISNSSHKSKPSAAKPETGVFTQPSIQNFVAYDGDEPPWD